MNLLTWNCAMAFRKKYEHTLPFAPDVMVIQECEHKDKLPIEELREKYGLHQVVWYGKNRHKGIAVFAFGDYDIELMDEHDPAFEYVLPIRLSHKRKAIHLFAIWAMPHKTRSKGYVGQVWGAIHHYNALLKHPSILIGDFNSHPIWDHRYPKGCHSDVVGFLTQREIYSVYHSYNNIKSGNEKDPSFFLTKMEHKPYHLDYCFASQALITDKTSCTMGRYGDWISRSDHMPLVIEDLRS